MTTIRELLSNTDDVDIVENVFRRILVYHDTNDLDVSLIPEEQRVVMLVYNTLGIVGNGGFNYLFEGTFLGDPDFHLTAQAFRAINCPAATDAVQKALDMFPDSKPPADINKRLKAFRKGMGDSRYDINSQFWQAHDQIEEALVTYIREHQEQLAVLDDFEMVLREDDEIDEDDDDSESFERETVFTPLPHWARVAFAARCARLLLPIFKKNWPNVSAGRLQNLEAGICAAEQSAANAAPVENLDDSITEALVTAGAALQPLHGASHFDSQETFPPDGNMGVVASHIAKVVEHACRAAQDCDGSEMAALEAFSFARDAADESQAVIDQMYVELRRITEFASNGDWDDQTAVAPEFFGSASQKKPWWRFW